MFVISTTTFNCAVITRMAQVANTRILSLTSATWCAGCFQTQSCTLNRCKTSPADAKLGLPPKNAFFDFWVGMLARGCNLVYRYTMIFIMKMEQYLTLPKRAQTLTFLSKVILLQLFELIVTRTQWRMGQKSTIWNKLPIIFYGVRLR